MRVGIIGAGINGLWLAWQLAKRGNEVTVFESKDTIGKPVCSGLVSERIWHFVPRKQELVRNIIHSARIHFPTKTVKLNFTPRMLVLDHAELDRYVAELATKAGAKIMLGHSFTRLFHISGSKPQIAVSATQSMDSVPPKHTHVYEFDVIIGSDGPHSMVRQQLGIPSPKFRLGMICFVAKKDKSDVVDVYPHKHGFSWIIPRGENIEYGTLEEPGVAKKQFGHFCAVNRIKPKDVLSATIPHGLVTAAKGNVALAGDAIGLTKSWSWGGIVWGLTGCGLLVKAFPNLGRYNQQLERHFGPRMFFSDVATAMAFWLGFHSPFLLPRKLTIDSDWVFE
ncbi:MAG: NAD(P)/FAD-dependent oxidoreductase [Candidatus Aenigmarchaeota archaeon]|nr:NAD(P)/FAD-dependent oxidoreductase [Candidatus Aenigmarchaeota archaeon]